MEMRHKIAAALKTVPVRSSGNEELDELRRLEAARVVLDAMDEPTEAMVQATSSTINLDRLNGSESYFAELAKEVWRDMLSAAKSP